METIRKVVLLNQDESERLKQIKSKTGLHSDSEAIRFGLNKAWKVVMDGN